MKIVGDGAVDPGKDGAIHLHPYRSVGVGHVREDVILEGIHAEDEEEGVPPAVVVGSAIHRHGDEHPDVDNCDGLCMHGGVLGGTKGEAHVDGEIGQQQEECTGEGTQRR